MTSVLYLFLLRELSAYYKMCKGESMCHRRASLERQQRVRDDDDGVGAGSCGREGKKSASDDVLLTDQDGSQDLKHSGDHARLSQRQHLGSYAGPEHVGHVVGTHAKGKCEGEDEADYNNPKCRRVPLGQGG